MSSRTFPTLPGRNDHIEQAPRYEPLPDLPLESRWKYVVGAIAAMVFVIALGFFLKDTAGDVIEDFSGYVTDTPEAVPDVD